MLKAVAVPHFAMSCMLVVLGGKGDYVTGLKRDPGHPLCVIAATPRGEYRITFTRSGVEYLTKGQ